MCVCACVYLSLFIYICVCLSLLLCMCVGEIHNNRSQPFCRTSVSKCPWRGRRFMTCLATSGPCPSPPSAVGCPVSAAAGVGVLLSPLLCKPLHHAGQLDAC